MPVNIQQEIIKVLSVNIYWRWHGNGMHIRQLSYQKTEVFVVHLIAAIFGDQRIKGFRKKKWMKQS